jgi:hypothetical protein
LRKREERSFCSCHFSMVTPAHFYVFFFFFFYYIASFKGTVLSSCIHFLTNARNIFKKEFKSPFAASDVLFLCCMCLFYSLEGVIGIRLHGSLKALLESFCPNCLLFNRTYTLGRGRTIRRTNIGLSPFCAT